MCIREIPLNTREVWLVLRDVGHALYPTVLLHERDVKGRALRTENGEG
jgi:hypothetical protein